MTAKLHQLKKYLQYCIVLLLFIGSCKKDSIKDPEYLNNSNLHTPVISYPINNYSIVNKSSTQLNFKWDLQYNIHHYEFTIAEDSFFNQVVYKTDLHEYYLNVLINKPIGGTLYWKVKAFDSLGYSTNSTNIYSISFKNNTEVAPQFAFNNHVTLNDIQVDDRTINIDKNLNDVIKYELYSSLNSDFLDTISNNHNINSIGVNKVIFNATDKIIVPNDHVRWSAELKIIIRAVFADNTFSNWTKPIYFNVVDPTIGLDGNYQVEYFKLENGVKIFETELIYVSRYKGSTIGQGGVAVSINGTNKYFSYYNCPYKVPCSNNSKGWFSFQNYPDGGGVLHFYKKSNSDSLFVTGESTNAIELKGYKSN